MKTKKISLFLTLAMMLLASAVPAKAQDCTKSVDLFCKAFAAMTQRISQITSVEEMENIDFDNEVMNSGLTDLPESCLATELSKSDKTKVTKALDGFVDAMINKTYELCEGMVGRSEIEMMMAPMKNTLHENVNKATTLGSLVMNMDFGM